MKRKKKNRCGLRRLIAIIAMGFLIWFCCYDVSRMYPYLFGVVNVNRYMTPVDTVWYNPSNGYHNDMLIKTILCKKTCICNPVSWYAEYYNVFAETVIFDDRIPERANPEDMDLREYEDVGYMLAYIHGTLVDHEVYYIAEDGEVPHLFVYVDSMEDEEKVVAFNDEKGNIYLIGETCWHEKGY